MSPLSYSAALVLQALDQGHRYGFQVMGATRLPSGTVYPLFRRLEAAGLVSSTWEEEEEAHADGRPPRRYYRLTSEGSTALDEARVRIRDQARLFGAESSSA
jgi:DNA-binding PadR family transcriptional regulator